MNFWTTTEIEDLITKYFEEDTETKKILGSESKFSGFLKGTINVIKRVFSEIVFGYLTDIYNSIFYSTSEKEALIMHLKDEGMTPWKQAKKSTGLIRIGMKTKPLSRKEIPLRTVIKTGDVLSKRYIVTESGYIDENTITDIDNYYTVTLAIESIETGGKYNVASGSICQLDSFIDGIDFVINDEQTANGRDIETIEEVRERLIDKNIGKTEKTRSWFVSETKEVFDWVVSCVCIPRYAGRGTVGIAIRVAGGVDPTTEQLQQIESYYNSDERDPAGAWQVIATVINSYF
ncbi:MAG: baseplate J/gp47 family protein [Spirochaetes bacterium]|nr:baseplate J/gp47 family protein [Spirochaetota bacterium]